MPVYVVLEWDDHGRVSVYRVTNDAAWAGELARERPQYRSVHVGTVQWIPVDKEAVA